MVLISISLSWLVLVFLGVPVGIVTIFVVSLLTPAPSKEVQELVDHVRYPNLAGDIDTRGT